MGKLARELFLAGMMVLLITGFAHTAQPGGSSKNPNGSPSGNHFILNVVAKGSDFTCPGLTHDEYGYPVYGNVVYIPEYPECDVQIVVEFGRKGPGSVPGIIGLQVTDACTGFVPGDPARLRLPENGKGYRVYARVLTAPFGYGAPRTIEVFDPQLTLVQDESGSNLLYLGLITQTGFLSTSASFIRTSGKSQAVDITGLFQWSGSICHPAAPDEPALPDSCCRDTDGDGALDQCTPVAEDGLCEATPVYCREYVNQWVFSIDDFVEYFWNLDSSGAKLLQIRFYPQ